MSKNKSQRLVKTRAYHEIATSTFALKNLPHSTVGNTHWAPCSDYPLLSTNFYDLLHALLLLGKLKYSIVPIVRRLRTIFTSVELSNSPEWYTFQFHLNWSSRNRTRAQDAFLSNAYTLVARAHFGARSAAHHDGRTNDELRWIPAVFNTKRHLSLKLRTWRDRRGHGRGVCTKLRVRYTKRMSLLGHRLSCRNLSAMREPKPRWKIDPKKGYE